MVKKIATMVILGISGIFAALVGPALVESRQLARETAADTEEKKLQMQIDAALAKADSESALAIETGNNTNKAGEIFPATYQQPTTVPKLSAALTQTSPQNIQPSTPTSTSRRLPRHRLQINPGFIAEWGAEDHFIDFLKAKPYPDDFRWLFVFNDKVWNTKQADEAGFIDPITGDPTSIPPGVLELQGPVMLFGYQNFPGWFSGDWVLTWEGNATANLNGNGVRIKSSKSKADSGRIVFTMPRNGATPLRARFTNLVSAPHNLKLYRLRHEDAIQKGAIWNPDFIAYIKKYDIIRTMVMQDMNDTPARSFEEIARPDDPAFAHLSPALPPELRPATQRYGLPYEYLLQLAAQTDSALWLHIPLQIGSPLHVGDVGGDVNMIQASARDNADKIINSLHWDEFTENIVTRLKQSQYPKDRELLMELGNEVWNYAWPFAINTKYADGIAHGITQGEGARYAYGYLTGRLMQAMEKALGAEKYNITYVIASQTANPETTRAAYRGLSAFLTENNLPTSEWLAKTGIALTTYHGGADAYKELLTNNGAPLNGPTLVRRWEQEIARDPEGLQKLMFQRYIEGGPNIPFGKNWLLQQWRAHQSIGKTFGVEILGAYEGGSHDNPPEDLAKSKAFIDWWTQYHWGPYGADIVREINKAVLEEFPGVILSDFTAMGNLGNWRYPWYDGHYSNPTAMMQMWDEFKAEK